MTSCFDKTAQMTLNPQMGLQGYWLLDASVHQWGLNKQNQQEEPEKSGKIQTFSFYPPKIQSDVFAIYRGRRSYDSRNPNFYGVYQPKFALERRLIRRKAQTVIMRHLCLRHIGLLT
jgi:hypothetical protein